MKKNAHLYIRCLATTESLLSRELKNSKLFWTRTLSIKIIIHHPWIVRVILFGLRVTLIKIVLNNLWLRTKNWLSLKSKIILPTSNYSCLKQLFKQIGRFHHLVNFASMNLRIYNRVGGYDMIEMETWSAKPWTIKWHSLMKLATVWFQLVVCTPLSLVSTITLKSGGNFAPTEMKPNKTGLLSKKL